jgi:hypothetical protein
MTENSNQAHKAELHNNFLFWNTLILALPPFTLVLALRSQMNSAVQID